MVGKRPYHLALESSECVVDFVLDRSTWCPKSKRIEGDFSDIELPTGPPLATPEALAFLDGLMRASTPELGQQGSELYWLCTADLNLLMAHNFSYLPSSTIRSYHSFTRTNKLQLWERILASSGLASLDQHTAALTASGVGGPMHLQMLNAILMRAFCIYPEASIVKYSFLMSGAPWLFGWAHKWGFAGKEICVLAVFAYHPDMESFPQGPGGQPPTRCVYIPIFS